MSLLHTAHLRVRSDTVEAFRARLLRHATTTLESEVGCSRFDVFQDIADPALFLLIEIYEDEAALDLHRNSPHYLAFRADVKDWVEERQWWYWANASDRSGS